MTKQKKSYKIFRFVAAGILLLAVLISFFFRVQVENFLNSLFSSDISAEIEEGGVLIHFIDVGHGDAAAVRFPDGKKMLIDCGPKSAQSGTADYIENSFFRREEEKIFDFLILTHQDEDHIGGAPLIYSKFQVNFTYLPRVYTPADAELNGITDSNQICSTNIFADTIRAVKNEPNSGYDYSHTGIDLSGSGYEIKFLTPAKTKYTKANNYSPILLLTYSGKRVMFTGDAEKEVENEYIEMYGSMYDVDVLKVGHHGSSTSSSLSFLNAIRPNIAVISSGNKYGLPTASTLKNLKDVGAVLYRTDELGTILISVFEGRIALGGGAGPVVRVYITWYMAAGGVCVLAVLIVIPEFIGNKKKRRGSR